MITLLSYKRQVNQAETNIFNTENTGHTVLNNASARARVRIHLIVIVTAESIEIVCSWGSDFKNGRNRTKT